MNDLLTNYILSENPRVLLLLLLLLFLVLRFLFRNRNTILEFSDILYQRRKDQEELRASLLALSEKIDELKRSTDRRFEENERKNNKRIRADLKDRIGRSYRYFHSLGEISDMELEALEDLIEEYEAADGQNSFVHSIVQKEMYTWEKTAGI